MDSESYWEKRMEELEQHWYDKGRQTIEQELTSLYEDALEGIQDDIAVLYGRFAKDNNLSIGDAMALLQGREYRKWRKSIEEYVKEINETGDKGLERELNTLAMRSRITRLDKLYAEVLMALDALGRKADKAMTAYLTDVYQDGYYHSLFEIGKKRGLEGSVSRISKEDAEKVVRTPWSGENYSKRLWNNTEKLGKTIRDVVSSGVHRGLSVQKLSKMVEERMNVGHTQAVRLVRTEMNFSLNHAILDGIKASGMKYYRFVATLDRRTSAQCRSHDGHVYKVEDYSPGTNAPPLHPHCRSTIVGSLKGDSAPKGSRAARDAENKYIRVPADMTYADWKAVYIDKSKTYQEWKATQERSIIKKKDFTDLKEYVGKLDDVTVREWYVYHDERIHEHIDSSLPMEKQARKAFELRNQYRTQARDLMADQVKRAELDISHPNKTWEEIMRHKTVDKGMSYQEAIEDIYRTAAKSNATVNQRLGVRSGKNEKI